MELMLNVVINHPLTNLGLDSQVEVLRRAAAVALVKFQEHGELALDESFDFSGVTDSGIPFEAWLVRPEQARGSQQPAHRPKGSSPLASLGPNP